MGKNGDEDTDYTTTVHKRNVVHVNFFFHSFIFGGGCLLVRL